MNSMAGLPPPARAAFLLDLDGTLIDIAPTPDSVIVPPGLCGDLRRVRGICDNALAIVTGRPIAEVDGLLGDAPYAVAGEHGTAVRHAPGESIQNIALCVPPASWTEAARTMVACHPGTMIEAKTHGLVLHYRAAPLAREALRSDLQVLLTEQPGTYALVAAKMAWEIRPAGFDKGTAVRALMGRKPFAGRLPVFIGDDVTDEDGMRAARALGGIGLRVSEAFGEAADVRAWLAAYAAQHGSTQPRGTSLTVS